MKFVFCNLYQQSQVKWIEFPDGGVTRGGHGERDVEAAEELLKRGNTMILMIRDVPLYQICR